MNLHFVTSNKGKAQEAQSILNTAITITHLEIPEMQLLSLEDIVHHKVLHAFETIKKPVFVDDVGLFIEAWNGFPGPFIKFLIESGGNALLLKMLSQETNRGAKICAAIGYHDGSKVHTFVGEIRGTIVVEPRGKDGWGFDPIFIPEGDTRTFAEMSPDEKKQYVS